MYNEEAVKLLEEVKRKLELLNIEAKENLASTNDVLQDFINRYSVTPNDIKKEKNLYHN